MKRYTQDLGLNDMVTCGVFFGKCGALGTVASLEDMDVSGIPPGSALSTQLSDPSNANTIWDKFLQAPTLRGNKIKIDILKSDSRMSTFNKTKEKKN